MEAKVFIIYLYIFIYIYIYIDIPAAALLWPRTNKPPAKIKSTSDAKNIMGEYNKLSAPCHNEVQIKSISKHLQFKR
jgi:hypothetical protein